MDFPAIEHDNGDLMLTITQAQYRLCARREIPGALQRVIALDGHLLTEGPCAGQLHVSCLKYRWPDGYEKWGHYLGSLHRIERIETLEASPTYPEGAQR